MPTSLFDLSALYYMNSHKIGTTTEASNPTGHMLSLFLFGLLQNLLGGNYFLKS